MATDLKKAASKLLSLSSDVSKLEEAKQILSKYSMNPLLANFQDSNGDSALMRAIRKENNSLAMELLKIEGVQINLKNEVSGETALTEAIKRGNTEIALELLKFPNIEFNAQNNVSHYNCIERRCCFIPCGLEWKDSSYGGRCQGKLSCRGGSARSRCRSDLRERRKTSA